MTDDGLALAVSLWGCERASKRRESENASYATTKS
jgi:hypothetical protein